MNRPEVGSDAQMTAEQIAEVHRQHDLAVAEALEEDRKTAGQPADAPRDRDA